MGSHPASVSSNLAPRAGLMVTKATPSPQHRFNHSTAVCRVTPAIPTCAFSVPIPPNHRPGHTTAMADGFEDRVTDCGGKGWFSKGLISRVRSSSTVTLYAPQWVDVVRVSQPDMPRSFLVGRPEPYAWRLHERRLVVVQWWRRWVAGTDRNHRSKSSECVASNRVASDPVWRVANSTGVSQFNLVCGLMWLSSILHVSTTRRA